MFNVSFRNFLTEEAKKEETKKEVTSVCEISINSIFQALATKAQDEAKKVAGNYKIINTACEGEGDKIKFLGAGTHLIVALNTSSDNMNAKKTSGKIDKGEALKAIKTYVSWFSGPDVASKITEKDLQPYRSAMSKEDSDEKNREDMNKMNKEKAETAKESMTVDCKLMKLLFEASEDEEKDQAADAKDNVIGYSIVYSIDIGGQKASTMENAWQRLVKAVKSDPLTVQFSNNLFGGPTSEFSVSVDDIENMGKVDASKVIDAVRKQFSSAYPNIKSPTIEVLDNKSLVRYLSKNAKLSSSDREKLQKIPYSINIRVNKNEQGYELLKKQDIADIVMKATQDSQAAGLGKIDISKNDVIFVNNYDDSYKNKEDAKFKKDEETNTKKSNVGETN